MRLLEWLCDPPVLKKLSPGKYLFDRSPNGVPQRDLRGGTMIHWRAINTDYHVIGEDRRLFINTPN